MVNIHLARVYEISPPIAENSFLIDRLWPRGISKARLSGVIWLKDVAPGTELRQRFHADPTRWDDFCRDYLTELNHGQSWIPLLQLLQQNRSITLLFGSKDMEHNQGVVLRDFLLQQLNVPDENVHHSGE
ncbi:DUF488 family protein [Budviciaceae bacterium BWR-B9]|uniref:DUF488 family protein n=1 Tax=Limnobaculum allomyrinae TaxID=2791986 RepID=A0ABS1IRK1_9GAMM|nr:MULTISPECIES: DUF488 family protein [Limnobaculum]MBK5144211.1 DUF488 family protein [Limnobaculum allomyrinae]MBV7692045.1 DUF488 family protein [Limnobaculum sp. M2-1]